MATRDSIKRCSWHRLIMTAALRAVIKILLCSSSWSISNRDLPSLVACVYRRECCPMSIRQVVPATQPLATTVYMTFAHHNMLILAITAYPHLSPSLHVSNAGGQDVAGPVPDEPLWGRLCACQRAQGRASCHSGRAAGGTQGEIINFAVLQLSSLLTLVFERAVTSGCPGCNEACCPTHFSRICFMLPVKCIKSCVRKGVLPVILHNFLTAQ